MAIAVIKQLVQQVIPNSLTTLYTVPSGKQVIVKELIFCNSNLTTARSFSLYFLKSGGTAGNANAILINIRLEPEETQIFGLSTVLEAGALIQAVASDGSSITATISGAEVA